LVQGIILGVLTAGVYALMASGQTLIFGIMKVINMAQGAMVILGAYLSFQLFTSLGVDPFLATPITTVVMFAVGMAVQALFLRPLRAEDRSQLSVLVTFAVALLAEGVMSVVWTTTDRSINTGYANASWTVFGYQITLVRLWAFLLSLFVLGLLYLLLQRTRFGRAVRASVQNPESARLLGVEADRVAAIGYGLGTATAAAAGSVYGLLYSFNSGSHYDLISRLLSIVMLGGLGSIGGSVVGALIISVSSAIVASAVSPVWSQMTFFIVLLLVLLIRPRGLFGTSLRGAI
jgi:branched-chain amino acid transport system permease protein